MKDIRISNFRCYDDKTMAFRKGINLLIGDNSSGKPLLFGRAILSLTPCFVGIVMKILYGRVWMMRILR